MYADSNLIKDANGIKCRLDEYETQRLNALKERTGQAPAVLVRNAVIEHLDRLGIGYEAKAKIPEFQQRRLAIAVSDRIRLMAEEVQATHSASPIKTTYDQQQTLFGG